MEHTTLAELAKRLGDLEAIAVRVGEYQPYEIVPKYGAEPIDEQNRPGAIAVVIPLDASGNNENNCSFITQARPTGIGGAT